MESEENDCWCEKCKQSFTLKKELIQHLLQCHQKDPVFETESQLVCDICEKKYVTKPDLIKHIQMIHQPINDQGCTRPRYARLMCPLENCEKDYLTYRLLRLHIEKDHALNMDFEELSVSSIKEFQKWKFDMEQKSKVSYKVDTGGKKLTTGMKRYYNCHCTYIIKNEEKRANKATESNKAYKTCPSRLETITSKNNGNLILLIKHWKTHYGHKSQIERKLLKIGTTTKIRELKKEGASQQQSKVELGILIKKGNISEDSDSETTPAANKDLNEERKETRCELCNQAFIQKKNLYRHLRHMHQIEPIVRKEKKIICNKCDKKLSTKASLLQHMKTFHNGIPDHSYIQSMSRKTRLICPLEHCQEEFRKYNQLRHHLEEDHKSKIDFEELTFDSTQDFQKWKVNTEQQTMSLYTMDTGEKKMSTGIKRYYNCHRSHNFKSKGKNGRAKKSNKINKACPSRMEVDIVKVLESQKVNVKFWKTHYGHEQKLGRHILDNVTRAKIAGDIKDGITFDKILVSLNNSGADDNDCKERRGIKRKDLHNIARVFDSDTNAVRRLKYKEERRKNAVNEM